MAFLKWISLMALWQVNICAKIWEKVGPVSLALNNGWVLSHPHKMVLTPMQNPHSACKISMQKLLSSNCIWKSFYSHIMDFDVHAWLLLLLLLLYKMGLWNTFIFSIIMYWSPNLSFETCWNAIFCVSSLHLHGFIMDVSGTESLVWLQHLNQSLTLKINPKP